MSDDTTTPEYIKYGPKVDMTIHITGRLMGPTRVQMTTLSKTGEMVSDGADWGNFPDALISVSQFAEDAIGVLVGAIEVDDDGVLVEVNPLGETGE